MQNRTITLSYSLVVNDAAIDVKHLRPVRRKILANERMNPVRRLGVVIDVVSKVK